MTASDLGRWDVEKYALLAYVLGLVGMVSASVVFNRRYRELRRKDDKEL
jgi:hypothetical protein